MGGKRAIGPGDMLFAEGIADAKRRREGLIVREQVGLQGCALFFPFQWVNGNPGYGAGDMC